MSGIYIHIPFCRQACHYCNFHFSTSLRKKAPLLQALNKEAAMVRNHFEGQTVKTLYFGGGTPSILAADEIDQLIKTIFLNYHIAPEAEITLEANPDDITEEKLNRWKESGITRLSIGVQSFFEEDLKWMNRAHNATQALKGLQLAQHYFFNITVDLIYGIPGLTNEKWLQNIQTVVGLEIPHLSCYALTVEPKTPLAKLIHTHKKENIVPEIQAQQFQLLMEELAIAGYEHYEISNFSKPGWRSQHNTSYWQGKSYIGIGPAAHSFHGSERWWNIANNQQYIDAIMAGILPIEKEVLTPTQQLNETIMLSLRTLEGMDLSLVETKKVQQLLQKVKKYEQQNLITQNEKILQLTPQGRLFADGIASNLFFDED